MSKSEELKKLILSFIYNKFFQDENFDKLEEVIKVKDLGEITDEVDLKRISDLISDGLSKIKEAWNLAYAFKSRTEDEKEIMKRIDEI